MNSENFSTKQLELDKILRKITEYTSCPESGEMVLSLIPMGNIYRVKERLDDTQAAFDLSVRYGFPSFRGLKNISGELARAKNGGSLSMRELLSVSSVLSIIRRTEQYRRSSFETSTCLDGLFDSLTSNKYLEDKINGAIISEDEMSDSASPELADIRRQIRLSSEKARQALDRIVKSSSTQKYLQEQVITIRDGRFVIPVKSEHRNEIPGLVHDTSATGSTLFIEPIATVEANNQLRVLKIKEKTEIDRILYELSVEVGNFADRILRDSQNLVKLDFIFAKAAFAADINAIRPRINESGIINLVAARHPLIDKNAVVPIDVTLGETFDTLIITGPNTGGKTVALKTVGLLTLMTMCGLMIPVRDGSDVAVFTGILADIGDEQSIEQSLSTFSAHMKNIIRILDAADGRSLVLFDELGSGTDPVEGAALAATIIEHLREKKCRIMATTHYAELKVFALETEGVENAACEFDIKTLRPTYRLLIGTPGKSNAFAISERLGLSRELVDRAKERLSAENSRFEQVIADLEASRQQAEKRAKEAENAKSQAMQILSDAKKQAERLKLESEKEAEKARNEARRIISITRARSEQLVEEIDGFRKKAEKEAQAEMLSMARSRMKSSLKKIENDADPVREIQNDESYVLPRKLKAGDTVFITDMGKSATVISANETEAELQAGIIKLRVPLSKLRLEGKAEKTAPATRRTVRESASRQTSVEIDVRGQTVEEAMIEIDRFIDGAVMSNMNTVTIIHGKGTGALRTGIHKFLKSNKSVKSFRLGNFGEGDVGVTVVELR